MAALNYIYLSGKPHLLRLEQPRGLFFPEPDGLGWVLREVAWFDPRPPAEVWAPMARAMIEWFLAEEYRRAEAALAEPMNLAPELQPGTPARN